MELNQQTAVNIAVIGAGYVGLVTGACLASLGHKVYCVDIDLQKIKQLELGQVEIYEPGLSELIIEQIKLQRLVFTSNLTLAVNNATAIFIAVGTPQDNDGKANLTFIENSIVQVANLLEHNNYKLIIIKSTVPVGTCRLMHNKILELNPNACFDIASNPEFLREGSAVFDFMQPERIVIGLQAEAQAQTQANILFKKIYKYFIDQNTPVLFYDLESSELIKYASNCFLAVKIAFINELADLCEQLNQNPNVNADILKVATAMGLDSRIGAKFLQPGPGIGGSCFPKDTLALNYSALEQGVNLSILQAAINANKTRISRLSKKIINITPVFNKTIAILGLAFKANTNDIRDSVSINVINDLYKEGAKLQVYDPKALEHGKTLFNNLLINNNILWCDSVNAAISNAEIVVVLTEWIEFANLNLASMRQLMNNNKPIVIDFRNLFDLQLMQHAGFKYYAVGRGLA